jgi:hypothetical protein
MALSPYRIRKRKLQILLFTTRRMGHCFLPKRGAIEDGAQDRGNRGFEEAVHDVTGAA